MAGNVHSDTAKKEQIITEFFAKTLHIILESRAPYVSSRNYSGEQVLSSPSSSSSSSSSHRPRDKWFNLALRECPAALENIDFWRQSNLDPMVVDVVLVQRSVNHEPARFSSKKEDFVSETKTEKVIERWVVQFDNRKSSDSGNSSKRSSGNLHTLYKKSILLLRSLYSTVRLLPAYKLFRELISSGQIRAYTLTHRVSSFVEPFTRKQESDMQRFCFAPVDTLSGRLCLWVLYQNSVTKVNTEFSAPMSPQFIPDYVGSPLADPLKRFPSLPVSQSSPSYSPFSRQHSWSYGTSVFPSPSPTYTDSQASVSKPRPRMPPMSLPHHLPDRFQPNNIKYAGFDEDWPSPAFSPSNSPSPVYNQGGGVSGRMLFRCESAPVRIPAIKAPAANLPFPPLKVTKPEIKTDKSSVGEKFSLGRDESGRFSGVRMSSNSSPRVSISSSRLSIQDDDPEFACPFAVDDEDVIDPGSRPGSYNTRRQPSEPFEPGGPVPLKKSQDAAVGALVLMLNKAPPLHNDHSTTNFTTSPSSTASKPEISEEARPTRSIMVSSSGFAIPKTTADALAELRSYREMKEQLIKQEGSSSSR